MRLVIGSDHAGFDLKTTLAASLRELRHHIIDVGPDSADAVDYPDYAEKLAAVLLNGRAERGILICGSGVGASVAANKIPGIRAGLCHDAYSARQGVEHEDINVLVLGARVIGAGMAEQLVRTYLDAQFTHEHRHIRRLEKLKDLETRYSGQQERETV
jgi:RpiB/LacA/LacB family sugar-phosphate isomerase